MNKPFHVTPVTPAAADAEAALITPDELVARGCRRIVSYTLEPPQRAQPSRQERHRARLEAEEGLKQINFPAAEDEGVRAGLRALGRSSRRPEVATALAVLVDRQDDPDGLALLARLADADFRAAAMRLATKSDGAGEGNQKALAPVPAPVPAPDAAPAGPPEAVGPPPRVARRDCEALVLRRIEPLPDAEVEAVAIAASPQDHRIRTLALQTRKDPKLLTETFTFAKLAPERRRTLLALDDATLRLAQAIAGRPEMGEVMRAISKDKRLLRKAQAQIGLAGPARAPRAAAAEKSTATRPSGRDSWLPSWLRSR